MRALLRSAFVCLALVAVAGCAALGSVEQGNAGITAVDVKWCETADGDQKLCEVVFRDGKEKESVTLTVKHPSGVEVSYDARAVKAFQAHEIRAAVETAIAETGKEVAPAIIDGIVKALTGL